MGDGYFFSCGVCSHPGFYACLADSPACVKCGRDPIQYRDSDTIYCFIHRAAMTDTYSTTSQFLLTDFGQVTQGIDIHGLQAVSTTHG